MALQFLSASGIGSTADAISAINYATMMKRDHGVNVAVTNNSWGGGGYSQSLYDAIEASRQAGQLFVASAGNDARNTDLSPSYPASYDLDNIISVASIDQSGLISYFSNRGATSVDLGAPGSGILSTTPHNHYDYKSGTSMAAPHVAGVAALAWSASPNAPYAFIRDAIVDHVEPNASLFGITATGGVLNANATLGSLGLIVRDSNPAEDELVDHALVDFVVNFSHSIDTLSVQGSDFRVNGQSADSFTILDASSVRFHFDSSPIQSEGSQEMQVVDGSILRSSDQDPVNGWTRHFVFDSTPLVVDSISPANGDWLVLPNPTVTVHFSENIVSTSVGTNDLHLSSGRVISATLLDSNTVLYQLSDLSKEQELILSMEQGEIVDLSGHPLQAFSANFKMDFGRLPYPTELDRVRPLGSLIRRGKLSGQLHSNTDVDSFDIALEHGQSVAIGVHPSSTLSANLALFDSSGNQVLSNAGGLGQAFALMPQSSLPSGLYRLDVRSAESNSGTYQLDLILDGALEIESLGAMNNDSSSNAQELHPIGPSLPRGGFRTGLVGTFQSGSDSDWYQIALHAGQSITSTTVAASSSTIELQLYDPVGSLLTTSTPRNDNAQQFLDYRVASTGIYYLRMRGDSGEYGVSVVVDGSFDSEPNSDVGRTQYIDQTLQIMGYVGGGLKATQEVSSNSTHQTLSPNGQSSRSNAIPARHVDLLRSYGFSEDWIAQATTVERDGRLYVTSGPAMDYWSEEEPISTYGILSNAISVDSEPDGDTPYDVEFTNDGSKFLIAHRDSRNVLVYDSSSRTLLSSVPVTGKPIKLAMTADGRFALSANSSGNVISVIDLTSFQVVKEIGLSQSFPYGIQVTPNGQKAVVATLDGFSVISMESLTLERSFAAPDNGMTAFSFSFDRHQTYVQYYADFAIAPDNQTLVAFDAGFSTGVEGRVRLFDIEAGIQTAVMNTGGRSHGVVITADGETAYLPTSRYGGGYILAEINLATKQFWNFFATEPFDGVNGKILLTPDEEYAITAGNNRLLFLRTQNGTTSSAPMTMSTSDFSYSFDKRFVFTSTMQVIDVASQSIVNSLVDNGAFKDRVAASPVDYRATAISTLRGEDFGLYNINGSNGFSQGSMPAGLPVEGDSPVDVALTPDERFAITANYQSKNISIIDLDSKQTVAWIEVGEKPDAIAISPDGRYAVTSSPSTNSITIVDLSTRTVVKTLSGLGRGPRNILISADSQKVFVSTTDDINDEDRIFFILLDDQDSRVLDSVVVGDLVNDSSRYAEMSLSPDGSILAVPLSFANQIAFFDTQSHVELSRISTGYRPIKVHFSEDGRNLYTVNDDSVSIIDLSSDLPKIRGTVRELGQLSDIAIDRDQRYLYAAAGSAGIQVVDLMTLEVVHQLPAKPFESAFHLLLIGNVLFVEMARGIRIGHPGETDQSVLYRFTANGIGTMVVDKTPLSGWASSMVYDFSRQAILTTSHLHDSLDMVSFANAGTGDEDYIAFTPQPGDTISIQAVPAGNANTLDLAFDLLAPNGEVLARSMSGSMTHTVSRLGSHSVRLFARGMTDGEYLLHLSGISAQLGPKIRSVHPVDDSTDILLNTELRVEFDREIGAGSGFLSIFRQSDNSLFQQVSISGSRVSISNREVVVTPAIPWELNTEYYVSIDTGALVDLSGSSFAGLSGSTLWSFSTGYGHDFGDAPAPYPVVLAENGPVHSARPSSPLLGAERDIELDGTHSNGASGDDGNGNDEDGVRFGTVRVGQTDSTVSVTVSNADAGAKLDAWIDFNGDGTWSGPLEQIAHSVLVQNGNNALSFDVPSWAVSGMTFARFRISTDGGLSVLGSASDGEVEDHALVIEPPSLSSGAFRNRAAIGFGNQGGSSIFSADMDGDGDHDIVSAIGPNNYLSLIVNDGTGGFRQQQIGSSFFDWSVRPVDIDRDGDIDVLSTSLLGNVAWHENSGTGRFTTRPIESTSVLPYDAAAADMDGDGDQDILVLSVGSQTVDWYENLGMQVFVKRIGIDGWTGNPTGLQIADMDRDGDPDFVINDSGLTWYENTNASFVPHRITSDATYQFSLGDLDSDGFQDIIVATYDRIALYQHTSGESYTHHLIGLADQAYAVATADFDGDGDLDVIANSSASSNSIAWYENGGQFQFAPHSIASNLTAPRSPVASDLDRDGDLDVLIVETGNGTIWKFENTNATTPEIVSLSPSDDSQEVSVLSDLSIQFDVPVFRGSGQITIRRLADDTIYHVIDVQSSELAINGTLVSINPTIAFERLTDYYVQIDSTAFLNAEGLPFDGIDDSATWNFKTSGNLILQLVGAFDTGFRSDDQITNLNNRNAANRLQFMIAGTVNGATIEILKGTDLLGTAIATQPTSIVTTNGSLELLDGVHLLVVKMRNATGDLIADSLPISITIDTVAPNAPSLPDLDSLSDRGISSIDNITNSATPVFNVTSSGNYFRFYRDGQRISGEYESGSQFATSEQPHGVHAYSLRSVDLAGNESGEEGSLEVIIDRIAPYGTLIEVAPDPRSIPVDLVRLFFSEPIAPWSFDAIELRKNFETISLGPSNGPVTEDGYEWTIPRLANFTGTTGTYEIRVSTLALMDIAGNAVETPLFDSWYQLSAPQLLPEPPTSSSSSNTLEWYPMVGPSEDQPLEYLVEYDTSPAFDSPEGSSGWILETSYTFNDLTPNRVYYYRVKARVQTDRSTSAWIQTQQTQFSQSTTTHVEVNSVPGQVRLAIEPPTPVFSDSFESGSLNGWNIGSGNGATRQVTTNLAAHGNRSFTITGGSGEWNGISKSLLTPFPGQPLMPDRVDFLVRSHSTDRNQGYFAIGESAANIDLVAKFFMNDTGQMGLESDQFYGIPYSAERWYQITLILDWQSDQLNYFVDGVLQFTDIPFRATAFGGNADALFRLYLFDAADAQQSWWDNIVFSDGIGGYFSSGQLLSPLIEPNRFTEWDRLDFGSIIPEHTALTVDVLNSSGNVLASNVLSGTDLSMLGIADASIRLRANFSTLDPTKTPSLLLWNVGYVTSIGDRMESGYSAIEPNNATSPPIGILLSPDAVNENVPTSNFDYFFSDLEAIDPSFEDTHLFELIDGEGSEDNVRFIIAGKRLGVRQHETVDFESKSAYSIRVRVKDSTGGVFESAFQIHVNNLIEAVDVRIDDGSNQRSRIDSVTLHFDSLIAFEPGAFEVKRLARSGFEAGDVTVIADDAPLDGRSVITLRFEGPLTRFGSLQDGNYELRIRGSKIAGWVGDDYVWGQSESDRFYSIFGDVDGNRLVTTSDFNRFRSTFGRRLGDLEFIEHFDFNADGIIGTLDFSEFRRRFGRSMNW